MARTQYYHSPCGALILSKAEARYPFQIVAEAGSLRGRPVAALCGSTNSESVGYRRAQSMHARLVPTADLTPFTKEEMKEMPA